MKNIRVDPNHIKIAEDLVAARPIANRGIYDGSVHDQVMGKIAEFTISASLGIALPESDGFDSGIDIVIGGLVIDIKCKLRRSPVKPWYCWNVPVSQLDGERYLNNSYLFCSFNDGTEMLEVSGFISKRLARRRSIWLPVGAKRKRSDGGWFPSAAGYPVETIEIPQPALIQINQWDDLLLQQSNPAIL